MFATSLAFISILFPASILAKFSKLSFIISTIFVFIWWVEIFSTLFAVTFKSLSAFIVAPIFERVSFASISILSAFIVAKFSDEDLFIKLLVFILRFLALIAPVLVISLTDILKFSPASKDVTLFFNLFKEFFVKYTLGTKTFWPSISSSTYHITSFFNLSIWFLLSAIPIDSFKSSFSLIALS